MKAFICDRCGNAYVPDSSKIGDQIEIRSRKREDSFSPYSIIGWIDICPKCYKEFRRFLRNKKVKGDGPEGDQG